MSASAADSAACVMEDGVIRGAAQEERFSRRPYDGGFPSGAIAYCLERSGVESPAEIDIVAMVGENSPAEWEPRLRALLPEFCGDVESTTVEASREGQGLLPAALREAASLSGAGGLALGAVIVSWQSREGCQYDPARQPDDVGLGPAYSSEEIREFLDRFDLPYDRVDGDIAQRVAAMLGQGHRVGLVQGGMEFGPRAAGHRSLLAAASPRTHAPLCAPGEPMVCSPIDAYRCMMRAGIDCLVMEDVLVWRREQTGGAS
mgnify:CR=1 FL=1